MYDIDNKKLTVEEYKENLNNMLVKYNNFFTNKMGIKYIINKNINEINSNYEKNIDNFKKEIYENINKSEKNINKINKSYKRYIISLNQPQGSSYSWSEPDVGPLNVLCVLYKDLKSVNIYYKNTPNSFTKTDCLSKLGKINRNIYLWYETDIHYKPLISLQNKVTLNIMRKNKRFYRWGSKKGKKKYKIKSKAGRKYGHQCGY